MINYVKVEKAVATHSSSLAWKIPWMEEPGGLQSMGSRRVGHDWATSLSLFTFHFHALEKAMATHSSVLAWRIPGMGEPGGRPSMGSHRVGHNWSDLAAAAAAALFRAWTELTASWRNSQQKGLNCNEPVNEKNWALYHQKNMVLGFTHTYTQINLIERYFL